MNLRKLRALVVLALLLLVLACAHPESRKPNVLLITLDTFRADRLGPATPNLNRLGQSGVRFTAAQSPVPMTLPAHASILSGLLPTHHGLRTNGIAEFPADHDTLATQYSQRGYRTAAFVGAFVLDHRFGLARGFDIYDDEVDRGEAGDVSLEASRPAETVVTRGLAWLRGGDARPFFAWVHLWDAHAPYAPPAPHPQTYDGEIAYVDAQVGRLLQQIDRTNTVIVVVGDHGEALGEHGELTHGLLLYQSTLHVPLLVAAPEVKPRVIDEPVSSVDLAPTIAALSGFALAGVDGRDLSASIRDGRDPATETLYAETQYPLMFGWSELASARQRNIKLIAGPSPEVFDLARDPRETANVRDQLRRPALELDAFLRDTQRGAIASSAGRIDDETKRKLASLGYIASSPLAPGAARPDPKSMLPLFVHFERALADISAGRARDALAPLQHSSPISPSSTRVPVSGSTISIP